MALGLIAGAFAGSTTGVLDGALAWADASQFLFDGMGRLKMLGYLAALYGGFGALIGMALSFTISILLDHTQLGSLYRFGRTTHDTKRAQDPRDVLVGLSLALAGLPTLAAILGLTYWGLFRFLSQRKHMGLIIGTSVFATLAALLAGVVLIFVFARPIESLLRKLASNDRLRSLSSPWAPVVAGTILGSFALCVLAYQSWSTLRLLELKPIFVLILFGTLLVLGFFLSPRMNKWLDMRPAWFRRAKHWLMVPSLLLIALLLGASSPIQKASQAFSGLGKHLAGFIYAISDWDGDGYSRFLSGGDCDDGSSAIYPGALEIPSDGVDNNCVGGDASPSELKPSAPQFYATPFPDGEKPNMILITIDTLRSDHLGAYGYSRNTSPNLDRLASKSALFENGWAHAPSTRYSIPAILTGRYPLSVKYKPISGQWPGLSKQNTTIAEVAQKQGLSTGAILNYWYFDPIRAMNQGFDHYDNKNKRLHRATGKQGPAKTSGSSSKEQTDAAIKFIETERKAPFFLWVHYYDPHFDYETHKETLQFGTSPQDKYDHEIAYTDHHVGRLLDKLKAQGIDDQTVVVVTGDHGEGFGEHGVDLHGYHLYGAQTRVPFIVHVPGLAPRRIKTPVGHVDILPTLANLLGADPSEQMMGHSLVDLISGDTDEDPNRMVFQQLSYENNNEKRGAASTDCHLLYDVSPKNSWEIYNLTMDSNEEEDIVGRSDACAKERRLFEEWLDQSDLAKTGSVTLLESNSASNYASYVDFDNAIRFLDVEAPVKASRGEDLTLTYTWQSMSKAPAGYKVFIHFEEQKGGRFIGDHSPAKPFESWTQGDVIQYTRDASIPQSIPPGVYTIWLGVFKGAHRLPATSQQISIVDDRANVGTITIQ